MPRAGRDRDVVLGVRRVERGGEPARRASSRRARRRPAARRAAYSRERAAGQPLHADPQQAASAAACRSSSCGAPRRRRSVRIVRCWPCDERVVVAQVAGHGEGDRDRVVGQRLDGGHPRAGGRRACWSGHRVRCALKWSNGSRQARHDPQRLARGRAEAAQTRGCRGCRTAGSAPTASARPGRRRRRRRPGRRDAVRRRACAGPPRSSSRWSRPARARARTSTSA